MEPRPTPRKPLNRKDLHPEHHRTEVPGRPDADENDARRPAYGPGGAQPVGDEPLIENPDRNPHPGDDRPRPTRSPDGPRE